MKRSAAVHTVFNAAEGGWINRVGTAVKSRHRLKTRAVAEGRRLAIRRRVEHVIHRADGVIAAKNSYGRDPFPPRG